MTYSVTKNQCERSDSKTSMRSSINAVFSVPRVVCAGPTDEPLGSLRSIIKQESRSIFDGTSDFLPLLNSVRKKRFVVWP